MPSRRSFLRAGGVVALGALAGCGSSPFTRLFRAADPADGEWPAARRGPRNTACAPAATPPRDVPDVAWRTAPTGEVHDLLVRGDTVYAARPRETTALDAATGDRRWTTASDGQAMVPGGRRVAALADGALYTLGSERLRAFDPETGTRLWWDGVGSHTVAPLRTYGVQVTEDAVVVGFHGGLSAFRTDDGAHRWTVSPGGLGWVYPAVAHGRLYVGSPGPLYAYDRAAGPTRLVDSAPAVAWQGNGPVFCTWPAVAGDRIVVADRERSAEGTATTVWAYDRDGTLDWRCTVPGAGRAPAVTPDGTVIVTAGEEPTTVVAVDLDSVDGTVRWRRELSQYAREPIVAGDVVLVGGAPDELAESEVVRALDVETGEPLWEVGVDGRAERLVAVGDRVYVGTDTGRVVALA